MSAFQTSPPFGPFGHPSDGLAISKPPAPEAFFLWRRHDELEDAPASMGHPSPSTYQEPLQLGTSSSWDRGLTQSSSGSWMSGFTSSSASGHSDHPSGPFYLEWSPQFGISNPGCGPVMQYSESSTDLVYAGSFDGRGYTQSIVESPGPDTSQPYFPTDIHSHEHMSSSADWICTSPTSFTGHGIQSSADQDSELQIGMNVGSRKRLSASSASLTDADDGSMLECCGHRFASRTSFKRHRKGSCKADKSREKRFQCNPDIHCSKRYLRRCGLKKHLGRVGLTKEQVDGVVRAKYGKGMHRRPI